MLEKMIESKNDSAESFRRTNFLLSTLFLVAMILSGAMLYSLYAKPLGTMGEDLELSSIVAPVAATEPATVNQPKKEQNNLQTSKAPAEAVRVVIQKSIDESPLIPNGLSIVKNPYASRPAGAVKIGSFDSDPTSSGSGTSREGTGSNTGITTPTKQATVEEDVKEPPQMPKVEPKAPQPIKTVSLGVINGSAKYLPVPAYPAAGKAIHAQGAVNVQITVDEKGRVTLAKAVSGHPLLRPAAEQAAQHAIFSPTQLSNVPVKVTGVIVYNFVAQ